MMRAVALALMLSWAGVAHAQRDAVATDLSPEKAADVFRRTVQEVCVPAVVGTGITALAAARSGAVQPTNDQDVRRQAGAAAEDTVWEVGAARGVVTVREGEGRCTVAVYGPGVGETIAQTAEDLARGGFKAAAGPWSASSQTLLGASGGKRVAVQLSGSEPGDAGHLSRFPVITATVFPIDR